MLGRRMGFLSSFPPQKIKILAAAVKQLFVTQHDSNYGMGLWRYIPSKTYRDFSRSEELIYRFEFSRGLTNLMLIMFPFSLSSIISEIVDRAITDEHLESSDDDVRHVFLSILLKEELDIREKKSAIVDFIAAGIETVIWIK